MATYQILDCPHAVHHVSLALSALGLSKEERLPLYREHHTAGFAMVIGDRSSKSSGVFKASNPPNAGFDHGDLVTFAVMAKRVG